jgi:glutathione S-transferase
VSLQLFGHPFSSYTQKVLIALWADETPFEYRILEQEYPENMEELKRHWPFGLFPLLLDDGRPFAESTPIIEHLQAEHGGIHRWIPDGDIGRRVRFLDRFFDLYVMDQMSVAVFNALRPEESRDPFGVERAMGRLRTAYDWLEANLGDGPWAIGEEFTLADCAAAPSLF